MYVLHNLQRQLLGLYFLMPFLKLLGYADCLKFPGKSAQILANKVDIDFTPKIISSIMSAFYNWTISKTVSSIVTEFVNLGDNNDLSRRSAWKLGVGKNYVQCLVIVVVWDWEEQRGGGFKVIGGGGGGGKPQKGDNFFWEGSWPS